LSCCLKRGFIDKISEVPYVIKKFILLLNDSMIFILYMKTGSKLSNTFVDKGLLGCYNGR